MNTLHHRNTIDVHSINTADSILDQGRATREMLAAQNEMIREASSRLYAVGDALGVSRSTMRHIEAHVRRDRMLIGCAILTIVFVCAVCILWKFK